MSDLPLLDRETILRAVRAWSRDEQRVLAGEILRHAGARSAEEPLASPDSAGLAGLLTTGQAPVACAQLGGLDLIITSDSVGFRHAPMPVVEPAAVVGYLVP